MTSQKHPHCQIMDSESDDSPLYTPTHIVPKKHPRVSRIGISSSLSDLLKHSTPPRYDLEHGMPSSYNPFVLSFTNLTYTVADTKLSKTLLDGVSGDAREGQITAVLGASGSGKSTLIDALAGRISRKSLKGLVTLNGEALESRMLKAISAYVMQDDLLFPMLTVEETLMFSAEFRLSRSLSRTKKKARVHALIDQLGLRNAAHTVIGDEGHRGVSGGERRRVSIGMDIIHDPIMLFLDEPTSGLDSTSAFMVVKVLQKIAHSGSVVIMSIHQPSYRIMNLFNRMIFLSRGSTAFCGAPRDLPLFLEQFGRPVPDDTNRIEFALDLIQELEEQHGTNSLVGFNREWQTVNSRRLKFSKSVTSLKEAISASISKGKLMSDASATRTVPKFANPFWIETMAIFKRSMINSRRMPELFAIRFGAVLVTGIILATIFWRLDESPKGAQERLGFFAFAMSTTYYSCAESLPAFLQERYIFMRETAFNAYRSSSYVLAHSLVDIPSSIVLSIAFATVTFWAVGLDGGASGFLFYFLTVLSAFWAGSSFVMFLAGIVSHVMIGFTIVVAVLAYFLLFSGFFISRVRIPEYWIWFHYISLVKYPYEAVLQNEFSNPEKCFVRGAQMFDGTPFAAVPLPLKAKLLRSFGATLGMNIADSTCVVNGGDILKQEGITQISKWNCLWITIAWGFFFRILFYVTLSIGTKTKRR